MRLAKLFKLGLLLATLATIKITQPVKAANEHEPENQKTNIPAPLPPEPTPEPDINPNPEPISLGKNGQKKILHIEMVNADSLSLLAELAAEAGLGVVFKSQESSPINIKVNNETIEKIFNMILQTSKLKARRKGNVIYIGETLPNDTLITKSVRLEQVSAQTAGNYLASLGASQKILEDKTKTTLDPNTGKKIGEENQGKNFNNLSSQGILTGLEVSEDERLNRVTLTGEVPQVNIALKLLHQLDQKQKQVAVEVKIIDVDLDQSQTVGTNWSLGLGNNSSIQSNSQGLNLNFQNYPTGAFNPIPNELLLEIKANITNGNAKILTDPTLIVQEGQSGTVRITQTILTGETSTLSTANNNGSPLITTTPTFAEAGLILKVDIQRIGTDSINLSIKPTISAPYSQISFNSGAGNNTYTLLSKRELDSGLIRLKNNESLLISGIISDSERTSVSKVPILGDIPILGLLFRQSNVSRQRQEIVILLTPKILKD